MDVLKEEQMKKLIFAIFLILLIQLTANRLYSNKRTYSTQHINPHPPVIDGKLSDEVWKKGEWSGNFIQRKPYEGKSPFQETAFKILYDEENLYIAIQAYDSDIKKISRRMSRRDNIEGDYVTVNIDSNNDKLTAYTFKVSAAGVKGDEVVSENGMISDDNWDPIWNVKTSVNENGWIAEIRKTK